MGLTPPLARNPHYRREIIRVLVSFYSTDLSLTTNHTFDQNFDTYIPAVDLLSFDLGLFERSMHTPNADHSTNDLQCSFAGSHCTRSPPFSLQCNARVSKQTCNGIAVWSIFCYMTIYLDTPLLFVFFFFFFFFGAVVSA